MTKGDISSFLGKTQQRLNWICEQNGTTFDELYARQRTTLKKMIMETQFNLMLGAKNENTKFIASKWLGMNYFGQSDKISNTVEGAHVDVTFKDEAGANVEVFGADGRKEGNSDSND